MHSLWACHSAHIEDKARMQESAFSCCHVGPGDPSEVPGLTAGTPGNLHAWSYIIFVFEALFLITCVFIRGVCTGACRGLGSPVASTADLSVFILIYQVECVLPKYSWVLCSATESGWKHLMIYCYTHRSGPCAYHRCFWSDTAMLYLLVCQSGPNQAMKVTVICTREA